MIGTTRRATTTNSESLSRIHNLIQFPIHPDCLKASPDRPEKKITFTVTWRKNTKTVPASHFPQRFTYFAKN